MCMKWYNMEPLVLSMPTLEACSTQTCLVHIQIARNTKLLGNHEIRITKQVQGMMVSVFYVGFIKEYWF